MIEESSSKTPQTNLEIFSLYILHASDNLGTSLVTCILKEENYLTWHHAMINALQSKSKYGFVDGSITCLSSGAQEESAWIECNSMVLSWIFNSLHPTLHDSVTFFVTACGERERKVHQFLMGLNEKYKTVHSEILNMDPLPSFSHVYAYLAQEEHQQLIVDSKLPSIEATTFFNGKSKANTNQKSTGSQDLSKLFCEPCKKSRHTKDSCFELHDYPEWWEKGKKSSKPKVANNAQHLEKDEGNTNIVPIAGLTNEQYTQGISMHNLEKSQTSIVNLAGKANFLFNDNTKIRVPLII
ncbi:Integrase, catalytic core [Gossypium australe]|uniref:Integrase, catalytic core n=1 Tax=Gossypium australe TaxID=47621 RepID=A0A5B6WYC8_9ROSI|nr:Integrase, catalytic core [Gossypium australe]